MAKLGQLFIFQVWLQGFQYLFSGKLASNRLALIIFMAHGDIKSLTGINTD